MHDPMEVEKKMILVFQKTHQQIHEEKPAKILFWN